MARYASFCITVILLSAFIAGTGRARSVQGSDPQPVAGRKQDASAAVSTTGPSLSTLPLVIYVGDSFLIEGSGFTPGSVVNFFVATAGGPVNFGPFDPTNILSDSMMVYVPLSVIQGEGVVSIQIVNTDEGHLLSNSLNTLLQGDAGAGLPSLTGVNGVGLSPTSAELDIAIANVEAVVFPGAPITLSGSGFDVANGVGVDLFCDCPGGKVGPFFLAPGNPGLQSESLTFDIPSGMGAPVTGPGSLQVTNLGNGAKSAAVSIPIGSLISVSAVSQSGSTVTVEGTGFSTATVINFFNDQGGTPINLGGLNSDGTPKIPVTVESDAQLTFTLPAGVKSGPGYIQALNPPFIPFTSSGSDAGGAFTVM